MTLSGPQASSKLPFKAMVFAAGLGKRMHPLSIDKPKPLIEVAGKALIDHMLDRFAADGLQEAVINVHYHADQIEEHLERRRKAGLGPHLVISDERQRLLDQAGGIKKALPLLGNEPFIICNTDAFWIEGPRSNLQRLAACFDPERMDMALLVAPTVSSVGVDWGGDFLMDGIGHLSKRPERLVAPFAYSGIGIVKPQLFVEDPREVFPLSPFFFQAAEAKRLFGVRLDGTWLHVGTPQAVGEAELAINNSAFGR